MELAADTAVGQRARNSRGLGRRGSGVLIAALLGTLKIDICDRGHSRPGDLR